MQINCQQAWQFLTSMRSKVDGAALRVFVIPLKRRSRQINRHLVCARFYPYVKLVKLVFISLRQ